MNGVIIPRKASKPVTDFKAIQGEVIRAAAILANPPRVGIPKRSVAIHHSQINPEPFDFFVIVPELLGAKRGEIVVVMNAKILSRDKKVKVTEGCMSFPFRHDIPVNRYMECKVGYNFPEKDDSLGYKEEVVAGIIAQIFQHEIQHARGENIYQGAN